MATYHWEVPLEHYFDVCALIMEADELSRLDSKQALEEVIDKLLHYPGYPYQRRQDDLVVVVPKDTRIWITPADAPTPRILPGLPK